MWGSRTYGLAAMLLGAIMLCWQEFAQIWQPVPDELPEAVRTACVYGVGAILLASGAALLAKRLEVPAALAVAAISLVFTLGWVRRIGYFPHLLGMWLSPGEQLSVVLGGLAVVAARRPRATRFAHGLRLAFGLCLVAFGTIHFLSVAETAAMVPAWLPPGQRFWALATGAAAIAAGLALLAGPFALLAARLATAMLFGFAALVWVPRIIALPAEHVTWSGMAMTVAVAAAAWAMADLVAQVPPPAWWRRGR